MKISRELLQSLIDMSPLSDNALRTNMNYVHIEAIDAGRLRVKATNGYALVERTLDCDGDLYDFVKGLKYGLAYEKENNAKLRKIIKEHKKVNLVDCKVLADVGLEIGGLLIPANIYEFPNTDRAKPNEHNYDHTISFNPELLFKLCKAHGWVRGQPIKMRIAIDGDTNSTLKPLIIDNTEALLMPCRL